MFRCLLGFLTSFAEWRDDLGVTTFVRALAYLAFITTAALTGAFLTAKIHWWAGGMYWGPGAVWIEQEVQLVTAISVIAAPFNAVMIHTVLRFAPVRLFATA